MVGSLAFANQSSRTGAILRRLAWGLAVALVPPLLTVTSRADQIYGFLSDGPWQTGAGDAQLAQTFSTGGLRMTLDSVRVWTRDASESNQTVSPGTLNLSLYETDGDRRPTGSSLLTITSGYSLAGFADEQPTFTNLGYTLSANTTYAVVFQGSAGSTIGWKYPSSGSPSPVTGIIS